MQWIVNDLVQRWGSGARSHLDTAEHPHEANYLKLDISKAKAQLGWQPRWTLANALEHIVQWHRVWLAKGDVQAMCLQQIQQYQQS